MLDVRELWKDFLAVAPSHREIAQNHSTSLYFRSMVCLLCGSMACLMFRSMACLLCGSMARLLCRSMACIVCRSMACIVCGSMACIVCGYPAGGLASLAIVGRTDARMYGHNRHNRHIIHAGRSLWLCGSGLVALWFCGSQPEVSTFLI